MIKLIINIIIGLILGIIFYKSLFKNVIYKGPNSNIIKKQIYQDKEGNCYKFNTESYICPI